MRSPLSLLSAIFLIAVTGLVATLATDSSAQSDASPTTIVELKQRIDALETRVERLESQLSGVQQAAGVAPLSFTPRLPTPPLRTVPGQLDDTTGQRIPKDWKRGEINGIPFYTLPLSNQDSNESGD